MQNDGVTAFYDEFNVTAVVVKPQGTAAEMLAIINWRIELLEELPTIQKHAKDQGITFIAEMNAKGSSDYSAVVDANGKINLLNQSKYNQVLKILHDQKGVFELINAFSSLGDLDTNGNGQIDVDELFQ